jgi:hypothetical protein
VTNCGGSLERSITTLNPVFESLPCAARSDRSGAYVRNPSSAAPVKQRTGRPHHHSAAHTIIVLDGELDANGQVIGPGSYAHFPAGEPMRHQAANNGPCLFVVLFHGPFDVHLS